MRVLNQQSEGPCSSCGSAHPASCGVWNKSLALSGPHFAHLSNGSNSPCAGGLLGLLQGSNKAGLKGTGTGIELTLMREPVAVSLAAGMAGHSRCVELT